MDIKMPVMNGFEATRQIKLIRPNLSVIAQNAFTSKEDKEKAKQAGFDNFITSKGTLLNSDSSKQKLLEHAKKPRLSETPARNIVLNEIRYGFGWRRRVWK
jgi:CheY-like chemotaxis protein